jgi:hypothetical protein
MVLLPRYLLFGITNLAATSSNDLSGGAHLHGLRRGLISRQAVRSVPCASSPLSMSKTFSFEANLNRLPALPSRFPGLETAAKVRDEAGAS